MENVEPPMCANGCGFYGSSVTFNYCSKCFTRRLKDTMVTFQITEEDDDDATTTSSPISDPDQQPLPPIVVSETVIGKSPRCGSCRKKVGLLGFTCRCGTMFCGSHRHPEDHCCKFDHKKACIEALQKANPRIQADRLPDRI